MPNLITEQNYTGEVLAGNFESIARDQVTLIAGQNLAAGAVLGRITASGKFTAVAPAATDGSQTAVAVLYAATNASAADTKCVAITRLAELANNTLVFPAGITAPQRAAAVTQLAAQNLIVRA